MQKSPKISAINPKYVPVQYQQQQQKKWTPLPFKNYVGTQFNVSPTSKFFVIKSYTLLDVNASFINNIWASTELGNKRLSSAFKKAADDQGEVYLFFSVNGSGKFCGVAKMTSDLDMEKSSNIWFETSKWKGVFDVDWLMVKDIPNKYFHFLKVAANENKPVSNSRDTQEIPLNIALEMLKIFSTFKTSTSFLMC
ncbi:YTH-domain-containing protein [Yamadazyma tenuis ATCC 10573]|uniref:YTH-domain-containing protein n=2 Tax=Candida tenuis TaxID=2315449 RepID=G3B5F4_CANTC|nr:YTH-domain-containing protein [Yamadazyma tenuis ATCC 10573]EGV63209.1 YTH-domain-containing protein [Yamadazyma tenuis ATCC 10573]